ncbi:MAG: hypothetical protein NC037_01870 [Bacteroides sp.]|nr:hypothetical protein [Bacillota bacterium]MCM1394433.1 hypothetical protein [[Eubacterium] siraeum]MCM1455262.1 hypothetical protein [Bacteroides sp.]
MRKAAKENIIVVCTIVLCFMVTIGLCTVLSGGGILGVFSASKSADSCAYAVAVGGYSDMTLARSTADLIKNRGGAGYVIGGDSIEIIYAVYPDGDSAKKVLDGLGDNSAYVKEISINSYDLKWASGNIKTAAQTALGYYNKAFDALYDTANLLADGSIGAEDARTKIGVLTAQIGDIKSNFYQSTIDVDDENVTNIKLALITALALLDNVKTTGTTVQFVSSMRYALVQLTLCRQAL